MREAGDERRKNRKRSIDTTIEDVMEEVNRGERKM
jgi:hypothetical protein